MAKAKTKDYVLLSKHRGADGKVYQKGDTIKLTEEQAANLTNKVLDPKDVVVTNNGGDEKLVVQVEKLEGQVAELTKQLEDAKAENAELTKQLDEATANTEDL